ncbi:MAG TPA: hypothetical protein VL947_07450 [Cytophagales bacterium]|nr:hypothetical protein [Cytophagales bacterium]
MFIVGAQINIIDVPTPQVSGKSKIYFQQEVHIGNRDIISGTIINWGIGKNFEAGISLCQLTFHTRPHTSLLELDPQHPEETPRLMGNLRKTFVVTTWMMIGVGTQTGMNITRQMNDEKLVNFSYLSTRYSIPSSQTFFILGGYYANRPYAGEGNSFGAMAGFEWELVRDRLSLITDYLMGNNDLSVINMGIEWPFWRHWQLDLAYQIPSPSSNNVQALVIQLGKK